MIFQYTDYKEYLNAVLLKGQKSTFAKHIGCQPSFVSQVLRGNPDLSLEQAVIACDFLKLTENEAEHFMLLVHYSRAGSQKLKAYYARKIKKGADNNLQISHRIAKKSEISAQEKLIYYSSWIYPVVHVLVSIPHKNQINTLSSKLNISLENLKEILHFLESIQVIELIKGDRYIVRNNRVHLPATDPMINIHHKSFRNLAIQKLERPSSGGLHFSSIFALSEKDMEEVRNNILRLIGDNEKILGPSREEIAYVFNLDFFSIF